MTAEIRDTDKPSKKSHIKKRQRRIVRCVLRLRFNARCFGKNGPRTPELGDSFPNTVCVERGATRE
jgi:hypothetical protein